MADPLSTAASVVGLLTAAAQISKILANIIRKAHHAPDECRQIKGQVDDIRNVLGSLQLFIMGTNRPSRSRTSLIMVEQVVVTLAACVTTFSELDAFVAALELEIGMSILDRLRWATKDKEIQSVLVRLESHKSSLTLILMILTCQSQDDAEDRVSQLCELVERTLEQNTVIKQRLLALESQQDEEDAASTVLRASIEQEREFSVVHKFQADTGVPDHPKWQRDSRGFAFEELLANSKPYRQAARNASDGFSVITSAGRTASWSMLSGLSLSEVSHIGIQAIPIYASDITNKDAYDFSPTAIGPAMLLNHDTTDAHGPAPGKEGTRDRLRNLVLRPLNSFLEDQKRSRQAQKTEDASMTGNHDQHIFGVELKRSIVYANVAISLTDEFGALHVYGYIPLVIAKVGVYLKDHGTKVEDIFSLNGHPARMLHLQNIFDIPPKYGKGLDWDANPFTVHDAAGIFLRYLKSLPEPVIPYPYYETVVKCLPTQSSDMTEEEVAAALRLILDVIQNLPPVNRQLLLYILDLMAVFADQSAINKMTSLRLVSVFQPSVLSGPPDEMDADACHLSVQAVVFLVDHQEHWLVGGTVEPADQ